ncbi:hypothetical protein F8388_017887 [Cannabis sativa]|uniref:14-3-3 domain-containing protein n=1 Tax=Cannabis sativa TaxID=3483 RepID=A0A7J6EI38_CANSA|nr:hypothetical protein G4B88_009709 [Cannabis sativa]KAF4365321.1 hypothetical protein F8388_017887 [Cannabis sativa]
MAVTREDNVYMAKSRCWWAHIRGAKPILRCLQEYMAGPRRASWRIVSSIEQKEETRGNVEHVSTIKEYRSKIENELASIFDDILDLLERKLVPSATAAESKVGRRCKERLYDVLLEIEADGIILSRENLGIDLPPEKIYDFDRDHKDVGVALFTTKYFVVRNCLPNAKLDMLLSAWNPPSEWGKYEHFS